MSDVYSGGCLCGGVAFEVAGPFREAALCHCSQCRRSTGAAFNVAVPVATAAIRWHARETLTEFESSPGKWRGFCRGCGAAVFSRRDGQPDRLRLRGGLIGGDWRPERLFHIFADDRLAWIDDAPAARCHPGREPDRD